MSTMPTKDELLNLLRPLVLISLSAYYLIPTVWDLLTSLQISTFFSLHDFQHAWFSRFWVYFGPRSRDNAEAKVKPLLANNAAGVCLDIGPGSGQWLYLFARSLNPTVTKIYGVEPNPGHHKALRENAVKAGLGEIYEIIGAGAEDLGSKGIAEGSIDTIITVQVLCSVPGSKQIIKDLYPYLKPGGRWIVYEHIKTKFQGDFVGYWQGTLASLKGSGVNYELTGI